MSKYLRLVVLIFAIVSVLVVWLIKTGPQSAIDAPIGVDMVENDSSLIGVPEGMMASVRAQIEHLKELEKDDPDNLEVLAALGNIYFDAGMAEQAVKYYDRVLAIQPDNVDVLVDKATMLQLLKRPGEAVRLLEEAVKIAPEHEQAWFNLGVIYSSDLNDPASAIAAWKRFLEINPNATHADAVRGEIERMEKDLGKL